MSIYNIPIWQIMANRKLWIFEIVVKPIKIYK